ncbi:MAG: hypothetical protein ACLQE9_13975 [Roseiarcus sp.]
MTLQNRVDPFGELVRTPARGMLLGNRGGRFHREDRSLAGRRWASRQWIACLCVFGGRQREVWGRGYTELFFLDEVTALAAGHRPCFECRRAEAEAFRALFGGGSRPKAAQIDAALDRERRDGRQKRLWERAFDQLPVGAMVALDGRAYAISGDALLPWSFEGYGAPRKRPRGGTAFALTPPSILGVLAGGYRPRWAGPAP